MMTIACLLFLLVAVPLTVSPATAAQIDVIATGDASAPVASRFDGLRPPFGVSDDGIVAFADTGGIALSDGTAVVSYGDPVPGLGRLRRFASPAVNSARQVAFLASASPDASATALLLASGGQLEIVAKVGAPSPDGTPFVSLGSVVSSVGVAPEFALNDAGSIAFRAKTQRGYGMFLYVDGALQKLAVIGDTAPNGALYTGFDFQSLSSVALANRPALSDAGEAAFLARTDAGLGLFAVSAAGGARTVAMRGDSLPGGGEIDRFTSSAMEGLVDINSNGDVAFFADPVGGYGQGGVFVAASGGLQNVVSVGDAAPGGRVFSGFGGCCYASQLALNDAGEVTFSAWLDGTSGRGIFRASGGAIAKVVAFGDPAPGGGTFQGMGLLYGERHALSDNGAVAFTGYVDFPPFLAVFRGEPDGSITQIARDGDIAPTRASFRSFVVGTDSVAASGDIVFQSDVGGGAIFLATSSGIHTVAKVGDPAPGGGTFASIPGWTPPAVNSDGEICFVAIFEQSGIVHRGVYAGHLGDLRRVAVTGEVVGTSRLELDGASSAAVIDGQGEVAFTGTLERGRRRRSAVLASADDRVAVITAKPYGVGSIATNSAGDLSLWARKGRTWVLHLSTDGRLSRSMLVRSTPEQWREPVGPASVSAARDMALSVRSVTRSDAGIVDETSVLLHSAAGVTTSIATGAYALPPDLNGAGELVFAIVGEQGTGVFRWAAGTTTPVLEVGDATPAGVLDEIASPPSISEASATVFAGTYHDDDGIRSVLLRVSP